MWQKSYCQVDEGISGGTKVTGMLNAGLWSKHNANKTKTSIFISLVQSVKLYLPETWVLSWHKINKSTIEVDVLTEGSKDIKEGKYRRQKIRKTINSQQNIISRIFKKVIEIFFIFEKDGN